MSFNDICLLFRLFFNCCHCPTMEYKAVLHSFSLYKYNKGLISQWRLIRILSRIWISWSATLEDHLRKWSSFPFSSWRSSSSPASPWLTVSKNSFSLASAGKRLMFFSRLDLPVYRWSACSIICWFRNPNQHLLLMSLRSFSLPKKGGVSCIVRQM